MAARALETLIWLGSPASVPAVKEAFSATPQYETFARTTAFMMQAGGPDGRRFMLETSVDHLDTQSKAYFAKIQPAIRDTTFASMRSSFAKLGGDQKLSETEVKARLAAMIQNYGKDERTNPIAILDSNLDTGLLIDQLNEVRRRTLYRLSDEALSDVEVTNALLNALRYKTR